MESATAETQINSPSGDPKTSYDTTTSTTNVTGNNPDQSLRESDIKALKVVQDAVEDKLVVITHGPFTAEAYEPSRKAKTHEQLQIARRIRATLEQAYHQAKESNSVEISKIIFEEHRHVIYELISLTNAVQGRYVLDNYDEFNNLSKKNRMDEEKRHCDSMKQINTVWEDLYHSKRPDDVLEDQIKKHYQKKMKRTDRESILTTEDHHLKKASISNTRPSKPSNDVSTTFSNYQTASKTPQKSASQSQSAKKVVSKTKKPMFHNTRSRRCHYCDTWSNIHRSCTFWNDNGVQCRKSFCLKCLRGNPDFEQEANSKDDHWQCPSCLGHCVCYRCLKRRVYNTTT